MRSIAPFIKEGMRGHWNKVQVLIFVRIYLNISLNEKIPSEYRILNKIINTHYKELELIDHGRLGSFAEIGRQFGVTDPCMRS